MRKMIWAIFLAIPAVGLAASEEDLSIQKKVQAVEIKGVSAQKHEFSIQGTDGVLVKRDDWNRLSLFVDYSYLVAPQVQVGVGARQQRDQYSNGDQESWGFIGFGPTLNFSERLNSSAFFDLRYLWVTTNDFSGKTDQEQRFSIGFGKRWALGDWVSYRPSIHYVIKAVDSDGNTESPQIEINFLALSLLL